MRLSRTENRNLIDNSGEAENSYCWSGFGGRESVTFSQYFVMFRHSVDDKIRDHDRDREKKEKEKDAYPSVKRKLSEPQNTMNGICS